MKVEFIITKDMAERAIARCLEDNLVPTKKRILNMIRETLALYGPCWQDSLMCGTTMDRMLKTKKLEISKIFNKYWSI